MKIVIIGYGRMGHEVESQAEKRGHEIVDKIDGTWEKLPPCDVAIDFTMPTSAPDNIKKAAQQGIPVVCGTTGWLDSWEEVTQVVKERGTALFYASNFSLGVFLFRKLNQYLARIMAQVEGYTASMSETHHIHKLDYPSGTALTLAHELVEHLGKELPIAPLLAQEGAEGSNDGRSLPIYCYREGEVPGTHSIQYLSQQDKITIEHEAFGREGFALGAVLAAEFIQGKKGIFGMDDLMPNL